MRYSKFLEHENCLISEESKQNGYNMLPQQFLLGIFERFYDLGIVLEQNIVYISFAACYH